MQRSNDFLFTKSEENTLAAQRYDIVRKIGEGSYAKVLLCKKTTDGKVHTSACKIIDTKVAPAEFVRKFLPREIDCLLKIRHQYIIHVEFLFQRRAKYYILMRFAENSDLLEYILSHTSVAEPRARFWMTQLFHALRYLHDEENIVHRDIKCENILLTEHYNVRVCDFGFARQMDKKDDLSKTYCGSRAYTAPEVLRGKPYNPKKYDIWSAGVVLMVMINKKFPFNEPNNKKLIQKMMDRKMTYRPKTEETVSIELKEAVKAILEPDPKKRWTAVECLQCPWLTMDERITKHMAEVRSDQLNSDRMASVMKQPQVNDDTDVSQVTVLKTGFANLESTFGVSIVDAGQRAEVDTQEQAGQLGTVSRHVDLYQAQSVEVAE